MAVALDVKIGFPLNTTPPMDRLMSVAKNNEDNGVDDLWMADHLMAWYPQSIWTPDIVELSKFTTTPHVHVDCVASMAVAALATQHARIGSAVTEPFRRHPAMIAQEFLTLDHISKGRVILGFGAGEGENTVPYGIPYEKPVARFEEALKIIRLLWENEGPVDFDGKFWKLQGAIVALGPYEPGKYPPIWVAAHRQRMLELAGRFGDGWCPTKLTPDEFSEALAIVHKAARDAGRDPNAITPALMPYAVPAKDHKRAHELMEKTIIKSLALTVPPEGYRRLGYEHPLGDKFYGLRDYIPGHWSRNDILEAVSRIPFEVAHEFFFHGTPEDIAEKLKVFHDRGLRAILFWNIAFMGDISLVRESYGLLYEVIKLVKGLA